jgi:hypothetical protein
MANRLGPLPGEQDLQNELLGPLADDPRRWIQFAWPWGQADTPLYNRKEPNRWQIERHEEIAQFIRDQKIAEMHGKPLSIYRSAVSGGRGGGKTADDMMLLYWFFSTQLGGTVIVTANNQDQLTTRTWAELGVWHGMAINKHWFERATLSLKPADWFKEKIQDQLNIDTGYYYVAGQLWDKDRPEAFAGVHNRYGLFVSFQEAIGIPSPIWTVTNGFYTDNTRHRYFLASSNPRRNTGEFYECFHRKREQWRCRIIDSRTVEHVDVTLCNAVIEQYGINSVEACAEVTGEFPGQATNQFISRDLVNDAAVRELFPDDPGDPWIVGVDVARFGDDRTVIQVRKGRDARSLEPLVMQGYDNVHVANKVAELADKLTAPNGIRPHINIDMGHGAGVIDILRSRGYKCNQVDFGASADEPQKWRNKRTEMYARCKEWLTGGCILDLRELRDDLSGPEYGFSGDNGVIILETKLHMKDRGLASPDRADALVLTFAVRVARLDVGLSRDGHGGPRVRIAHGVGDEYNPFDS